MPASISKSASTIVTTPVGSQASPTLSTRATQGVKRVHFTSKDLSDADRLYQVMHAMQQNLAAPIHALSTNPTLSGTLLRGVVLVGGAAKAVAHLLGRAYLGFWCAGTHGVAWTGFATDLPASAFPGLTSDKAIVLTNPSSGTFDFWVF